MFYHIHWSKSERITVVIRRIKWTQKVQNTATNNHSSWKQQMELFRLHFSSISAWQSYKMCISIVREDPSWAVCLTPMVGTGTMQNQAAAVFRALTHGK